MRAQAFDELADTYDATFTGTAVGRTLREIVWARIARAFQAPQSILELGCGTGEDAVRLASRGVRVLATDPSPRMIGIARAKAGQRNGAGLIEFACHGAEGLSALLGARQLDGVLANFGAINCVVRIPALACELANHLRPGGRLLWVVMGRHVPWEWAWYGGQGRWDKAWRRLQPGGVSWRGLNLSYPTPRELARALQPWFNVDRLTALGFALPPTYAAGWLNRSPRMLSVLTHLERMARRSQTLASLADHYIVEATRRPGLCANQFTAPSRTLT